MKWKNIPPYFLILLSIITIGAVFVLAQQQLTFDISDTASFTENLLYVFSIASLISDTASFTENLLSGLGIASLISDTASFTENLTALLGLRLVTPLQADAISFTDSLISQLGLKGTSVQSPGGTINLNISDGVFTQQPTSTSPTQQQLQQLQQLLASNQTVTLPHGIVSFQAITSNPVITLTITYPNMPTLASNQSYAYYKLNDNNWVRVPLDPQGQGTAPDTVTISQTGSTVTVILRITDNGPFDFDSAPGVIKDPGGLAIITTTTPPAGGAGGGGGGGGGGAVVGGGGGGGGGGAVIITPQRSTVATQLGLAKALPAEVSLDKDIAVEGSLTDDKDNKLLLDGIITIIAESGDMRKVYTTTLKQGDFTFSIKATELLKAFKSRAVAITVKFDGFEVQQSAQRIVEYKATEVKHTLKITGEDIAKSIKKFKRADASLVKLDNFTDKKIAKIVLKAEGDDGKNAKIIYAKGKDMDRKRISMQEVELTVKDGKIIGLGDTARLLVYARGTVTYTVYDMQGNVIGEGRL